ncbi:MAG: MarR family transcriptional regulator [Chloroflexota bacterium]
MQRVQTQRTPAILDIGISMAQVKVLHAVAAAQGLHAGELATWVGTTPSTISGLVDRLVDQGLLARRDDPTDRRQVLITTTQAGLELIDKFRELNRQMLHALLVHVPDDDLPVVIRAFRILDGAVEAMAADAATEADHPAATHPRKDAP